MIELDPVLFDDDDLFAAWVTGAQRILHDESREAAERVHAGGTLATLATHTPGQPVPAWGTIPASLPAGLHETWTAVFDDDGVVEHRLAAALALYRALAEAALAEEGEEILRREMGS